MLATTYTIEHVGMILVLKLNALKETHWTNIIKCFNTATAIRNKYFPAVEGVFFAFFVDEINMAIILGNSWVGGVENFETNIVPLIWYRRKIGLGALPTPLPKRTKLRPWRQTSSSKFIFYQIIPKPVLLGCPVRCCAIKKHIGNLPYGFFWCENVVLLFLVI